MTGETQPASVVIRSEHLAAEISPHGAELIRLQDRDGRDLLWNGAKNGGRGALRFCFPSSEDCQTMSRCSMAKCSRCDNMVSRGTSNSPLLARAYPNASFGSRLTMRRGNNFPSNLSWRLLLPLKMRPCESARPSSTNRHARCRFRSAFTPRFVGLCPMGVHGKTMKSDSKNRNPRQFVD